MNMRNPNSNFISITNIGIILIFIN